MTLSPAITSPANERIKRIRALEMKKYRAESGQFLAEGVKIVLDGLERGWTVDQLVFDANSANDPLIRRAIDATIKQKGEVIPVSGAVLEKLSHRDNPQSLIAVFRQRWRSFDDFKPDGVWVALDRVRDPGNLGTIARTVDSAGAKGVILIGNCTDPFATEAVRAAMGSLFAVELTQCSEEQFLSWRQSFRGQLVGTHLKGAVDYRSPRYQAPLIVMMGNEQSGLSDPLAAACTSLIKIPMRGGADSLNLAVATGVALYEAMNKVTA